MLKGKLSIGRYANGTSNGECFITIEDELSGVKFLQLELSAEMLGRAITGLSMVDCEFELKSAALVGMEVQRKSESVVIDMPRHRFEELSFSRAAAEPFLIDGWKLSMTEHSRLERVGKTDDGRLMIRLDFHRHIQPNN